MILGIVKGTVVATRKMPELVGYKFLLVEPVFGSKKDTIVAGDNIGAGVGEMVRSPPTRPPSMVWTIRRPLMLSSWASWTILPP